jgi:hypothetical protein
MAFVPPAIAASLSLFRAGMGLWQVGSWVWLSESAETKSAKQLQQTVEKLQNQINQLWLLHTNQLTPTAVCTAVCTLESGLHYKTNYTNNSEKNSFESFAVVSQEGDMYCDEKNDLESIISDPTSQPSLFTVIDNLEHHIDVLVYFCPNK